MTTIYDTEPTITTEQRAVVADWLLHTDDDGTTHHATLRVLHFGRPSYALVANLNAETEDHSVSGMKARGFFPFDAVKIATQGGVKRWSEKAAREFMTTALAEVRRRATDGDPLVLDVLTGLNRNS